MSTQEPAARYPAGSCAGCERRRLVRGPCVHLPTSVQMPRHVQQSTQSGLRSDWIAGTKLSIFSRSRRTSAYTPPIISAESFFQSARPHHHALSSRPSFPQPQHHRQQMRRFSGRQLSPNSLGHRQTLSSNRQQLLVGVEPDFNAAARHHPGACSARTARNASSSLGGTAINARPNSSNTANSRERCSSTLNGSRQLISQQTGKQYATGKNK